MRAWIFTALVLLSEGERGGVGGLGLVRLVSRWRTCWRLGKVR